MIYLPVMKTLVYNPVLQILILPCNPGNKCHYVPGATETKARSCCDICIYFEKLYIYFLMKFYVEFKSGRWEKLAETLNLALCRCWERESLEL